MNKWILSLPVLIVLALLCGVPARAEAPVRIFLATDTHHLSPSLTDYGPLFDDLVTNHNDGKLTERSGELVDAFLEKARAERADVVVLTGDLTFNGELQSLLELTEKLKALWDGGIPVLVIPGNHDTSSKQARTYFGSKAGQTETFTQEDFARICSCLGRDQALARDEDSFSFIYEAGSGLWLLMLDANTDHAPIGRLPASTLTWLEDWLKKAQEQGKTVLSFSHQNLLPVNKLYYYQFTIANCGEVLDLYRRYGVRYSFSGHSHIQHRTEADGLTEYVTGPLCVTPMHYAVITAGGGETVYEARTLGLYREEALERFRAPVLSGMQAALEACPATEEERELMAEMAADVNVAYFGGDWDTIRSLKDGPAWELWQTKGKTTAWFTYLWSIFEEY